MANYAPPVGINPEYTEKPDSPYAPPVGFDILCENLVETDYDMLSDENRDLMKDRVLDMIGCIFGGAIVKEDEFLESMLKRWGGLDEAPLFARSGRLPLPAAALLNCITARANDFGNMYFNIKGERIASHCGETLIPLGLTLADVYKTSGREFIAYNVAAEDFTARILYTLPSRWPTDMLMVSSAAAALASRYYKLDKEQTKVAMTYAATNSTDPTNSYYDYSQEFKYHNGASAQAGIMACELAKGGWSGFADPFFGHWGLVSNQIKDGNVLPSLYDNAFDDLGKVWYTEESFKRNPGGIPTTPAAECGNIIRNSIIEDRGKINAEEISKVRVFRTSNFPFNYYSNPFSRKNHTNALFSFRFIACCAILSDKVTIDKVQTDAILADKYLLELAETASMGEYESPDGSKRIKVIAEMKDGKIYEAEVDALATRFSYPGKEFIERKFLDQFESFGKLPRKNADKIIETVKRLDELDDMRELTELIVL